MATKKPSGKKPASVKTLSSSLATNPKKKWWLVLLLGLFLLAVGTFAYNKYLDYKNIQDMKALLADFQQLEKDIEEQTGEEFTIEADCGSVGKFVTSYSCSIYLLKNIGGISDAEKRYLATFNETNGLNCEQLFNGTEGAKNSLLCTKLVRASNESKSEQIYYDYDKSPGSPF